MDGQIFGDPWMNASFNIFGRTFFAIVLFWGLVYFFVPANGTPLATLLATYFSALIALGLLLFQMYRADIISAQIASAAALIFSLRVMLGVVHYVLFIDGSYFDQFAPTFAYLWDYEWLLYMTTAISQHWSTFGFGTFPDDFAIQEQKNILLMPYIALLYYLGGNEHFLNMAVLNSLHNVLVATTVAGIAATFATRKVIAAAFLIALLQPFGMFSSIMWRDSVGQFFLVAGGTLIIQYRRRLLEIGKPILGCLMLMSLRNIYLVVGVLTLFVSFRSRTLGSKGLAYSSIAVLTIFVVTSYFYLGDLALNFYSFKDSGLAYMNTQGGESFVKRLAIGLVGPFPWRQIFDPAADGREYLLADIFQAMFNLSVLILVFQGLVSRNINWREHPNMTLIAMVLMVMILGLIGYGHVSYVTVATVLLLPIIQDLNAYNFFRVFLKLVGVNLLLGAVY